MSDGFALAVTDAASPALLAAEETFAAALLSVAQAQATALLAQARELASGPLLADRTGAFVAGLSAEVQSRDDGIVALLRSSGPQAPVLEFGGTIPAHVILPSVGDALRFDGGAGAVFAKAVRDPGATIKPHPVLETALDDKRDAIVAALASAVDSLTGAL